MQVCPGKAAGAELDGVLCDWSLITYSSRSKVDCMLRRIDYYFNVCGLRFVWVVFDSPEVDPLKRATRQRWEARYLRESPGLGRRLLGRLYYTRPRFIKKQLARKKYTPEFWLTMW